MCIRILLVFLRFFLQLDSMWYDFGIICTVIENWWIECWVQSPFGCFIWIGWGFWYCCCGFWPNLSFRDSDMFKDWPCV